MCSLVKVLELRMNKEMCNHGIPRGRNRSSMGGGGLSTWPKVQFYAAERRGKRQEACSGTVHTVNTLFEQNKFI